MTRKYISTAVQLYDRIESKGCRTVIVTQDSAEKCQVTQQLLSRKFAGDVKQVHNKPSARKTIEYLESDEREACDDGNTTLVVVLPAMRTRNMQKDFSLRKMRTNKSQLGIALLEQSKSFGSVNKVYDPQVDLVVLHAAHEHFDEQLNMLKSRFAASEKVQQSISECFDSFTVENTMRSFRTNYAFDWLVFDTKTQSITCLYIEKQQKNQQNVTENTDNRNSKDIEIQSTVTTKSETKINKNKQQTTEEEDEEDDEARIERHLAVIDRYIKQQKLNKKKKSKQQSNGWFWWLPGWSSK